MWQVHMIATWLLLQDIDLFYYEVNWYLKSDSIDEC